MSRSNIRNTNVQVTNDDGGVQFSVIKGEQTKFPITLNWFTNLAGSTITAQFIEADNTQEGIPTSVEPGASASSLIVSESDGTALTNGVFPNDYSTNTFSLVIPDDAFDGFSTQPTPDVPVYAFFDITVEDAGTGNNQQVYVPVRGTIQIRYKVGG